VSLIHLCNAKGLNKSGLPLAFQFHPADWWVR